MPRLAPHLAAALCCFAVSCTRAKALAPAEAAQSVLFIGNSYTYVNDLPSTFSRLAASGGHPVSVAMIAPGGYKLFQHAAERSTLDTISNRKWDWVVMQEQSQVPSLGNLRLKEMYPAVRLLNHRIRESGATPVLFLTWGRKQGSPEIGFADFSSMQTQLSKGYRDIAEELSIVVAPVGEAWKKAVRQRSSPELWSADGSHPSPAGTYLAACVLYATLFRQDPSGLAFRGDLPSASAKFLQKIGGETALSDNSR